MSSMVEHGRTKLQGAWGSLSNMDEHGRQWVEHGRTWKNMDEHGRTWMNIDEHGRTWTNMEEPYLRGEGKGMTNMEEHGKTVSEGGGGD